jgi:hypothetical protein
MLCSACHDFNDGQGTARVRFATAAPATRLSSHCKIYTAKPPLPLKSTTSMVIIWPDGTIASIAAVSSGIYAKATRLAVPPY